MFGLLLCGTSAAAITASLADVPLVFSDLFTVSFNDSVGITTGRTYFTVHHPGAKVAPFTKLRLSIQTLLASLTVSKMYVGEVSATRTGFMFQSAPVQVTFDGGSASVSLPAGSSKQSDEVALSFSGAYALGIAWVASATGGAQRRLLTSGGVGINFDTIFATTDVLPDPVSTGFSGDSGTEIFIVNDIDVAFAHYVAANRILTSQQGTHVIKEGSLPALDNQIKTVNHSFYVVKG